MNYMEIILINKLYSKEVTELDSVWSLCSLVCIKQVEILFVYPKTIFPN